MNRFFLACTPRTGNVWIRRLLSEATGIQAIAEHSPAEIAWAGLPKRCIVAMHWNRTPDLVELLDAMDFSPIVTIRNPLDVLISILHFSQFEPTTAKWLDGRHGDETMLRNADPGSSAFLEYALSKRAAALLSVSMDWLATARATIRYEKVVAEPVSTLAEILETLGQSPVMPLEEVIERNTIVKMRSYSKHHFWKGRPGIWRDLIPQEHRDAIVRRHHDVFQTLGYDCDWPTAPTPEIARQRWQALCAEDGERPHSQADAQSASRR